MDDHVGPEDAAQALTQIQDSQQKVIDTAAIPIWYWWVIAGLMVVFAITVDSGSSVAQAIGVVGFVLGVLAATGWVVRRALHVQLHSELLGPRGALMILSLVVAVVGVTLVAAFGLRAAGISHPATLADLLGAAVIVVAGPRLTTALRANMGAHRAGGAQ